MPKILDLVLKLVNFHEETVGMHCFTIPMHMCLWAQDEVLSLKELYRVSHSTLNFLKNNKLKLLIIVELRSRSRSGRSEIDLSLTIFLVFTHPPTTYPHKLFSWLLRGLDMSDGPRMGWYDSSRV